MYILSLLLLASGPNFLFMEYEPWFKLKRYPHIGEPLTVKDYDWIKDYVTNKAKIREHSFLPLIHKCIAQRKFRADKVSPVRTPTGKRRRVIGTPKLRHIYYASHLDSIIFSYYNKLISDAYENHIRTLPFESSVVAYRKIEITPGSNKHKCNIDFAKTTFEFIRTNQSNDLSVIVADVTAFFDNLDHKILKSQWCKVLGQTSLPPDHYRVFKSLTTLRYVEGDQLYNSYGNTMLVEKGVPNSSTLKQIKRIPIKSNNFFKEKNAVAYCTKDDFLKNNLNLIITANNKVGIPQGSPISATLANVYMLDFDKEVNELVTKLDGFYQRYSDDLIIICKREHEDTVIDFIRDRIINLVNLEIQPSKTKVYRFENVKGKFTGFEIDEVTKIPNFCKTLEYLGFSFDGQRVLIKTSGFSKFYRSMKRSFKKSTSLAIHSKNPDKSIFKSRLYRRFTHTGSKRKLIYQPSKHDPSVYQRTKKYYWGNYLSYIYKANDSMTSLNNSDIIRIQGSRFWRKFQKLMLYHENRL